MALPEIMEVMLRAVADGKTVARVQSGDPSVYGAILEQMRILEREGVEYEIIPGVSAAFAAAALLKTELTVPEVSQTIIMTRAEGRVAMPPREQLQDLAAHGCSLVIFLSVTRMTRIVRELQGAGYPAETPIAVIYRVGWPEEMVIRGTLTDIAGKVRDAKINRQALVMVGEAVNPELRSPDYVAAKQPASSHLYSESYTHLFRNARSRDAGGESDRAGFGVRRPCWELISVMPRTAVIALSRHGADSCLVSGSRVGNRCEAVSRQAFRAAVRR